MRQTLFYIPHELFGHDVFGVGWALAAWLLFGVAVVGNAARKHGWTGETWSYLPFLGIVAAVIVAVLPSMEVGPPDQTPLGLPIRGYGAFVLAGIVAGVLLSLRRARQVGVDGEKIMSLAVWLFVLAFAGARLFFVWEYWSTFQRPSIFETARAVLMFTEGGLVVYGAVVFGVVALYLFSRWHRLPMLEVGDLIAPGMALGLALGRIGCLMNGCCYGGECEHSWLAVRFPKYASEELGLLSPPYESQLLSGRLHGVRFDARPDGSPRLTWVDPAGPAWAGGARPGMVVTSVNGRPTESLRDVQLALRRMPTDILLTTADHESPQWAVDSLPDRSLALHPTQIYSSINALLLCLVVWFAYPYRRHAGEALALLLGLYAVTRFIIEWIRNDERGQFGTTLTISQWVSVATLLAVLAFCVWARSQPRLAPQ